MTEPRAMKEIHDIRLKIYEESKNLTEGQRVECTHKAVSEIEEKYGIKFRRPERGCK
ncbi:hypothetical protein AGMMS49957_03320 [Synergistales bacterium]|nr:hypothetical protein AGMMS49957_03320 [Synergistales bacterium]